jgi:peptide/nickel transport system substrate-binding protein
LSSMGATEMTPMLFDALLRLDMVSPEGKFELKGELAESWSNPDPKTLVFKLRKGVKFHDGSDFTAEVAKFNIERMANHQKSTNKLMVAEIASVDVVDALTLRYNLKAPSSVLLYKSSLGFGGGSSGGPAMMSKVATDKLGDEVGNQPVGSGPFKFDQWLRDDRIVLKRFDGYWKNGADDKPLPYFDTFEEVFRPDTTVALLEVRGGNIEMVSEIPGKDITSVKSAPNLQYLDTAAWATQPYFSAALNPTKPPFQNNLKLRQAAFHAVDRESMAKVLGFGVGVPAYYLYWNKTTLGYDESIPKYNFDLEKSKKLLAEAGHPSGLDISLTHINRDEDNKIAQMVKEMWDKAGIRTTIDAMERLAFVSKTQACNFDANFGRMNSSPDPDNYSNLIISKGASNYACTSIPELDKCMEDGRTTYDAKQRQEIYKKCLTIVYENAYQTVGYGKPFTFVSAKELKGIRLQWASLDFKEAWLDK